MAIIPTATYQAIADEYDLGREQSLRATGNYLDAVQEIVDLTGTDALIPETDLLNTFYGVYLATKDSFESDVSLLPSLRVINNHVLNEGSYANLDAYAVAVGISFPFFWAQMCVSAGFAVDSGNIDPAPTDYPFS